MKQPTLLLLSLLPTLVEADTFNQPMTEKTAVEQPLKVAQPVVTNPVIIIRGQQNQPVELSEHELNADPMLTYQLLNQAIPLGDHELIRKLLAIYQTQPNTDAILIRVAQAKILALLYTGQ